MIATLTRHVHEEFAVAMLRDPEIVGVIVPKGDGDPNEVDKVRRMAGRPDLPVWFVGVDDGTNEFARWYRSMAHTCRRFRNMGVRRGDEGT